jgi:hypothetical protein
MALMDDWKELSLFKRALSFETCARDTGGKIPKTGKPGKAITLFIKMSLSVCLKPF